MMGSTVSPPSTITETPTQGSDETLTQVPDETQAKVIAKSKPRRSHKKEHMIPRRAFDRLVREIMQDIRSDLRVEKDAMEALQEATEAHLKERFFRCGKLADLCKLNTIKDDHWRFVNEEFTISASYAKES